MSTSTIVGVLRVAALAGLCLVVWFMSRAWDGRPQPLGRDAPGTEFSAARADDVLARILGPERPHPVSSVENAAVRSRIIKELSGLGVSSRTLTSTGCHGRAQFVSCATVSDVVADVLPGSGRAIVMLAHYDSVPAGPGAADDESGVATILETIRALKARGLKSRHPIVAVMTDGEEAGLLGAAAFLDNPSERARVGAVVNVEARGNQGPSLLFQTSAGDSPLIDLYARNAREYATSSLYAVIYKFLPNDTDLTLFIRDGYPSFNFAFSGNVAHYHTALDRRANLSLSTLQHHGDNLLTTVSALETADISRLSGGHDDVYLSVFGRLLPRLPAAFAFPLSIAVLALMLLIGVLSREPGDGVGSWAKALAVPLLIFAGSAAVGWMLHRVASIVSGQPDPSYAYPAALRVALAVAVVMMALLVSRLANARLMALSVWLWMSVIAVVTSFFLPGLSPYFLFPSLLAAPLILVQSRLRGAWTGVAGQAALLLAALPALVIWISLAGMGESVMGLALHPLFTVPAAFAAVTLLPLVSPEHLSRATARVAAAVAAMVALSLAILQGLQPAYSAVAPQRLSLAFVDDHVSNKASWLAITAAKLPASLRAVRPFSAAPQPPVLALFRQSNYVAPAGRLRFSPPSAAIAVRATPAGRFVTLVLNGSPAANQMVVIVPRDAELRGATVNGKRTADASWKDAAQVVIGCMSRDCRSATLGLEVGRKPFDVTVAEVRFGLPADGSQLLAARPIEAVRSQNGDNTVVIGKVRVPG